MREHRRYLYMLLRPVWDSRFEAFQSFYGCFIHNCIARPQFILHPCSMTPSHLTAVSVRRWHHSTWWWWGGGFIPFDEMKQVNFSSGLRRNEKQMSRRVTESVCVLSARPMWVMALIWPCAPRLFIILRWQGGAGKRSELGAPSWSITLEVSFSSYLTATWISAALVYRCQPIWMSSRQRKWFLCSLYQSRWVKAGWKAAHHPCTPARAGRQTHVNTASTWYSCEK